jgi:arginine N-succinyltransferase
MDDLPQLEALAQRDNHRVHTLPQEWAALERLVGESVASFGAPVPPPLSAGARYTFVLQAADGTLAGTASLLAQAGSGASFLSFRQDMMQQLSPDPAVHNDVATLMLCSDLSGYSQLAGYHAPGPLGRTDKSLLACARLMYAALAPQRFAGKFFASLPGQLDSGERSPFWDAVGRHFFQMDFLHAEALLEGGRNQPLIVGLMPHYPLYLALLPEAARRVVGTADPCARDALSILRSEGFEAYDYVDLCDGGPVLQASAHALRSHASALRRRVAHRTTASPAAGLPYLVCNARTSSFRAIAVHADPLGQQQFINLTPEQAGLLEVDASDDVLCVAIGERP